MDPKVRDVTAFLERVRADVIDAFYQSFVSQCTASPSLVAFGDFARFFHRHVRDCGKASSVLAPHCIRQFEDYHDVFLGMTGLQPLEFVVEAA